MTHDPLDELLRDAAQSYRVPPATPRDLMWERIQAARLDARAPSDIVARPSHWLRNAMGMAAVLLAGIVIGRATRAPDAALTRGVAMSESDPASPRTNVPSAPESVAQGQSRTNEMAARAGSDAVGITSVSQSTRGNGAPAQRFAGGPPSTGGDASSSYNVPRQGRGAVGDGTEMSAYRLAVVEHLARTELLLTGFRAQARENDDARTAGQQFAVLSRELLQNTRLLLATRATDDPTLTRLLEDLELVLMQISQYAEEGRSGDLDAINQSLDRRNVLPKLRSTIPAGAPVTSGT